MKITIKLIILSYFLMCPYIHAVSVNDLKSTRAISNTDNDRPQYLCRIFLGESVSRCDTGPRAECWLKPVTIDSLVEINLPMFSNVFELPNKSGFVDISISAARFSEDGDPNFIFEAHFYRTKNDTSKKVINKYADEFDFIKSMITSETIPKDVHLASFSRKRLECKLVIKP